MKFARPRRADDELHPILRKVRTKPYAGNSFLTTSFCNAVRCVFFPLVTRKIGFSGRLCPLRGPADARGQRIGPERPAVETAGLMRTAVENEHVAKLRFFSLMFLVPGLIGLMISATLSGYYMNKLPKSPDPQSLRMIPRNINGYTVYQTDDENRTLDLTEFWSASMFLIGLGMAIVHFQKWGLARALESEADDFAGEEG